MVPSHCIPDAPKRLIRVLCVVVPSKRWLPLRGHRQGVGQEPAGGGLDADGAGALGRAHDGQGLAAAGRNWRRRPADVWWGYRHSRAEQPATRGSTGTHNACGKFSVLCGGLASTASRGRERRRGRGTSAVRSGSRPWTCSRLSQPRPGMKGSSTRRRASAPTTQDIVGNRQTGMRSRARQHRSREAGRDDLRALRSGRGAGLQQRSGIRPA